MNEEFKKFDATMRKLMRVSHDDLKAKLDAVKAEKRKRKTKPSASGRGSREQG